MKKPRAKQARGFKTSGSCLAVFYVEQVALNRHVDGKKNKEHQVRNTKVSRQLPWRQGELFQPVSRGISRLESDGSDVLELS